MTKFKLLIAATFLGLFGSLFVGQAAMADCTTTPTAAVCAEEVANEMKDEITPVLTKVAIAVVALLAIAIGIPVAFRLTNGSAKKIKV